MATIPFQEVLNNGWIIRWKVEYEKVSENTDFGSKFLDRYIIEFDSYDVSAFQKKAPNGWEIRSIERVYKPDR